MIREDHKINAEFYSDTTSDEKNRRELFLSGNRVDVTQELGLNELHDSGFTGKGVRIGIFDSGISEDALSQLNIADYVDFTDNSTENDNALHGTFMSSVIGSKNPDCPGIAPEAEIFIIKVFNADKESYTSWFLEAFNYAQ